MLDRVEVPSSTGPKEAVMNRSVLKLSILRYTLQLEPSGYLPEVHLPIEQHGLLEINRIEIKGGRIFGGN